MLLNLNQIKMYLNMIQIPKAFLVLAVLIREYMYWQEDSVRINMKYMAFEGKVLAQWFRYDALLLNIFIWQGLDSLKGMVNMILHDKIHS